ncbi:hypothetical protein K458DRAFT_301309 [Lentithecium fluviatile CBS 122367]|uniref:NAP family protein n=1 Tax=Lentithecium fluviatile CBS 122367 TaxID=1168545 RepID=A0A6G1J4F5_9PLEO|nr:hypothetical protein K458DRAFT_301309 [Lentithecium fluviatile CBS 122367]
MSEVNAEEVNARFEELSILESEFEEVEIELIRKSNSLNAPLWKKRAEIIAKIPHFWTLVFEQAPPELDNFIQPSDSKVFVDCLQTFEVSRFEIEDPKGSPRSVSIKFGFGDNEYFTDKEIEKKFWFRKSKDWVGLVSEPVKIHWKKGKDLTGGLTDAAYELAQARKKLTKASNGDAKSKKDSSLPEYNALAKKIEESTEASLSFFAWFGFVSSYRWISAEESEQAEKEDTANLEKLKRGEKLDEDADDDDDEVDYQETEVFPQGDEIATLLSEDLWPSAIKYYKHSHEADDEELSDIDVSDVDDMDEDDSDDEIDIRGLVGKGRKSSGSPPPKKQRKA